MITFVCLCLLILPFRDSQSLFWNIDNYEEQDCSVQDELQNCRDKYPVDICDLKKLFDKIFPNGKTKRSIQLLESLSNQKKPVLRKSRQTNPGGPDIPTNPGANPQNPQNPSNTPVDQPSPPVTPGNQIPTTTPTTITTSTVGTTQKPSTTPPDDKIPTTTPTTTTSAVKTTQKPSTTGDNQTNTGKLSKNEKSFIICLLQVAEDNL